MKRIKSGLIVQFMVLIVTTMILIQCTTIGHKDNVQQKVQAIIDSIIAKAVSAITKPTVMRFWASGTARRHGGILLSQQT